MAPEAKPAAHRRARTTLRAIAAFRPGGRCAAAATTAACIAAALVSQPALGQGPSVRASTAPSAGSVLRLLNQERSRHGLRPLRQDPLLAKAARWQTRDMLGNGYFAHQRPGGPSFVTRIRRTGYLRGATAWTVGENIALGSAGSSGVARVVRGWMASPGHRENILSSTYRDVGIGFAVGSPQASSAAAGGAAPLTITTDFGRRFASR